jgi:nitric oxide dioxygenase
MTPDQIQIVRLTLAQATSHGHVVGREFYRHLFAVAPDLAARFSGDVDAESAKLKDALKLTFASLTDMRFLVATLESLERRGVARGLTDAHCRAIGKSLLWAMERRMGAAFTPQVCEAWISFLAVAVSILRPTVAQQRSHAA